MGFGNCFSNAWNLAISLRALASLQSKIFQGKKNGGWEAPVPVLLLNGAGAFQPPMFRNAYSAKPTSSLMNCLPSVSVGMRLVTALKPAGPAPLPTGSMTTLPQLVTTRSVPASTE